MAETRRYYSRVKGSRYVASDGKTEVIFAHGFADISDPEIQRQLDEIINQPGGNPLVFKQGTVPAPLPRVQQNAKSEDEIAAGEALMRNRPTRTQQEIGHISPNAGLPSDVNTSTADPSLMNEFQRARAEAEARAKAQARAEGAAPSVS